MMFRILRRLLLAGWLPALATGARDAGAQEPLSWGDMQREMAQREFAVPTARSAYGPGADQFGELRLPAGQGPWPVAVVVHGGCWQSIADLEYMNAFAMALNDMGWATWSLEFRRIDQPGGAWPGILGDVAAGLDHLRVLGEEFPLDLDRVVAAGHSSGGHLALWLAGRDGLPPDAPGGARLRGPDPLPVRGVVGLAPIADLLDYDRYSRCGPRAASAFLGEDPADRGERFLLSDPVSLGPHQGVNLVLFGEADPIVPPDHGRAYEERAAAAGQAVRRLTVPAAGHFELIAPWTGPWGRVEAALRTFLDEVGGAEESGVPTSPGGA